MEEIKAEIADGCYANTFLDVGYDYPVTGYAKEALSVLTLGVINPFCITLLSRPNRNRPEETSHS